MKKIGAGWPIAILLLLHFVPDVPERFATQRTSYVNESFIYSGGVAASLDAQEKLVGGIAGQRFGVDSNGLSFNHDIQDSFLF